MKAEVDSEAVATFVDRVDVGVVVAVGVGDVVVAVMVVFERREEEEMVGHPAMIGMGVARIEVAENVVVTEAMEAMAEEGVVVMIVAAATEEETEITEAVAAEIVGEVVGTVIAGATTWTTHIKYVPCLVYVVM